MYVCNKTIKVLCDGVFVVIFFKTMYNKTIIILLLTIIVIGNHALRAQPTVYVVSYLLADN